LAEEDFKIVTNLTMGSEQGTLNGRNRDDFILSVKLKNANSSRYQWMENGFVSGIGPIFLRDAKYNQ
jgi:hypothetical protein